MLDIKQNSQRSAFRCFFDKKKVVIEIVNRRAKLYKLVFVRGENSAKPRLFEECSSGERGDSYAYVCPAAQQRDTFTWSLLSPPLSSVLLFSLFCERRISKDAANSRIVHSYFECASFRHSINSFMTLPSSSHPLVCV